MQPLRRVLAASGLPNHSFQLHLQRRREKLKVTIVLLLQIAGLTTVQEDCLVAGISLLTPSEITLGSCRRELYTQRHF